MRFLRICKRGIHFATSAESEWSTQQPVLHADGRVFNWGTARLLVRDLFRLCDDWLASSANHAAVQQTWEPAAPPKIKVADGKGYTHSRKGLDTINYLCLVPFRSLDYTYPLSFWHKTTLIYIYIAHTTTSGLEVPSCNKTWYILNIFSSFIRV